MYYVYILECIDGSLYTGYTSNIQRRFQEHLSGRGAKYTKTHPPVRVAYFEQFSSKRDAMKRECEIKKLPRKKKLMLLTSTM